MTAALPWDEIAKADYKPWTSTINNEVVVNTISEQVNKGSVFSKIKANVEWLETNSDKEYSLNIVKYKKEQKNLKLFTNKWKNCINFRKN